MKCLKCGTNSHNEYCFRCKPKKKLRAMRGSTINSKSKADKYTEEDIEALWSVYKRIWSKRTHISEVSGEKLLSPLTSLYMHHIIPKQKCKEGILDEQNIILLSTEEHYKVETDKYCYEEINNRRNYLEKKYNIL